MRRGNRLSAHLCSIILLAGGLPHVAADTSAPSAPANLTAVPVSSSQINLSWNASADSGGSGLAGYRIYYNDVYIDTTVATSYSSGGLAPATSYCYTVTAYDNAGNTSAQSAPACATTPQAACTYALSSSSASVSAARSTGRVNVTASGGCSWIASSSVGWITITAGSSGSGNGTVSYSVAANTITSARSGTLTVAGRTFTVMQAGAPCSYALSSSSASIAAAGGSSSVAVNALAGCSWAASSGVNWIVITSGSSGAGSGTVFYSVTANPSTISRAAALTIAGQNFIVAQAGFVDGSATFLWARQAGGAFKDHAAGIATDASGNLYIAGWFETNASFGGITLPNSDQRADAFVAKYSSTGAIIWARRGGGSGDDYASSVAVDSLGNVLVAGYFSSTNADFGGGFPMASAGSNDCFVVKYSPSGPFLWSKRFGGEGNDRVNAIALDTSDNIYITGSF